MAKTVRIEPYLPEHASAWDALVEASNAGTLFHRQAFLAYHRGPLAQGFRHLLIYRGDKLAGVLPMGLEGAEARSPWGASFGGWVFPGADYSLHDEVAEALLAHAAANGIRRIRITPTPWPYQRRPDSALEFCLLRRGFRAEQRDLCQFIDLAALGEGDPPAAYDYACDKQIRKAQRAGMTVKPVSDLALFHALLTESRRKHGVTPTHSLEDLRILSQTLPDAFLLLGAYTGEALEAASLCFAVNDKVLLNFYTCHREESKGSGAANLVDHATITWARERAFRYYDFGTSSIKMEPNEGLIRFKEGFGSGSFLRETYFWEAS